MATRIEKLLNSEFKGISFFVESVSERGGRKIAVFDYPKTDNRTIQDLGGMPQDFFVECYISGSDYISDFKRLRKVLIEKEKGDLVLPEFGRMNVKPVTYEIKTNNKEVGKIRFSIEFKLEDMTGAVLEAEVTSEDALEGYNEVNEAITNAVLANYKPPKTNASRINALNDAKNMFETARKIAKEVNSVARKMEKAVGLLKTAILYAENYADLAVKEGVFASLASAVGIGDTYRIVTKSTDWGKNLPKQLTSISESFIEAFEELFSEGQEKDFDIPLWTSDKTQDWETRNKNRIVTVQSFRIDCLSYSMLNALNENYLTVDDVTRVRLSLQKIRQGIIDKGVELNDPIVNDSNVIEKLDKLQEIVFKILSQKEKEVYRITETDLPLIPATVAAYLIYAEEVTTREEIEEKADILTATNEGKLQLEGVTLVLEK